VSREQVNVCADTNFLPLLRIQEVEEDVITAGTAATLPTLADLGVPIANWDRVTGADTIQVVSEGGTLKRATRYSLTCRDVEKVAQLKAFMKR
jgi:alkylated DNA repair protein alkB family protein 6